MKKRLAVYPFTKELSFLLDNKSKLSGYELIYAVIPMGWEPFNNMREREGNIIIDEEQFLLNGINLIDILILCKPVLGIDRSLFSSIIKIATEMNIDILYEAELRAVFAEIDYMNWSCLESDIAPSLKSKSELSTIDVPVIQILSMGDQCEKLDIQLGISQFFSEKGYKPSLISSNPLSLLFGSKVYPKVLNSRELTFEQQVQAINSFIKEVEVNERPDLMILDAPGSTFKYNSYIHNGYGYIPFLISNAVVPDITIMSLYCGWYESQHLDEIKKSCFYKLGVNIDYFHLSSNVCQYNPEETRLDYFSIDNSYVSNLVQENKKNATFFNISDKNSCLEAYEKMYLELGNNIPIM